MLCSKNNASYIAKEEGRKTSYLFRKKESNIRIKRIKLIHSIFVMWHEVALFSFIFLAKAYKVILHLVGKFPSSSKQSKKHALGHPRKRLNWRLASPNSRWLVFRDSIQT